MSGGVVPRSRPYNCFHSLSQAVYDQREEDRGGRVGGMRRYE